MQLDAKKCTPYETGMSDALTPQIVRDRATAAHVSINKLMERAELPNSTFWRWEQGKIKSPHPVTLRKISDALDGIEAEREQI
jgi:transcriptional regulator with XRE-family HTH domain